MARASRRKESDSDRYELPAEQLRWQYDAGYFRFGATGEVEPLQDLIGQDRAIKAIEFGLSLNRPGYNIFVSSLSRSPSRSDGIDTYCLARYTFRSVRV
ncbi:MAG: AAA family ATPase [Dehalococcoidia bacterium]|nr:AAA family ATPase [Dehalococcoidia bacterium]